MVFEHRIAIRIQGGDPGGGEAERGRFGCWVRQAALEQGVGRDLVQNIVRTPARERRRGDYPARREGHRPADDIVVERSGRWLQGIDPGCGVALGDEPGAKVGRRGGCDRGGEAGQCRRDQETPSAHVRNPLAKRANHPTVRIGAQCPLPEVGPRG